MFPYLKPDRLDPTHEWWGKFYILSDPVRPLGILPNNGTMQNITDDRQSPRTQADAQALSGILGSALDSSLLTKLLDGGEWKEFERLLNHGHANFKAKKDPGLTACSRGASSADLQFYSKIAKQSDPNDPALPLKRADCVSTSFLRALCPGQKSSDPTTAKAERMLAMMTLLPDPAAMALNHNALVIRSLDLVYGLKVGARENFVECEISDIKKLSSAGYAPDILFATTNFWLSSVEDLINARDNIVEFLGNRNINKDAYAKLLQHCAMQLGRNDALLLMTSALLREKEEGLAADVASEARKLRNSPWHRFWCWLGSALGIFEYAADKLTTLQESMGKITEMRQSLDNIHESCVAQLIEINEPRLACSLWASRLEPNAMQFTAWHRLTAAKTYDAVDERMGQTITNKMLVTNICNLTPMTNSKETKTSSIDRKKASDTAKRTIENVLNIAIKDPALVQQKNIVACKQRLEDLHKTLSTLSDTLKVPNPVRPPDEQELFDWLAGKALPLAERAIETFAIHGPASRQRVNSAVTSRSRENEATSSKQSSKISDASAVLLDTEACPTLEIKSCSGEESFNSILARTFALGSIFGRNFDSSTEKLWKNATSSMMHLIGCDVDDLKQRYPWMDGETADEDLSALQIITTLASHGQSYEGASLYRGKNNQGKYLSSDVGRIMATSPQMIQNYIALSLGAAQQARLRIDLVEGKIITQELAIVRPNNEVLRSREPESLQMEMFSEAHKALIDGLLLGQGKNDYSRATIAGLMLVGRVWDYKATPEESQETESYEARLKSLLDPEDAEAIPSTTEDLIKFWSQEMGIDAQQLQPQHLCNIVIEETKGQQASAYKNR